MPGDPRMVIDAPWDWQPERCAVDADIVEWLAEMPVVRSLEFSRVMFHMGTGLHHLVGLTEARRQSATHVIGMTASPAEIARYATLASVEPLILHRYEVLFGDIHVFDPRVWLPPLDIVSLPHLGEFTDERRNAYGGVDEAEVLARFIQQSNPGATFLFYTGSVGYERLEPVLNGARMAGYLVNTRHFKSLHIMRKADR